MGKYYIGVDIKPLKYCKILLLSVQSGAAAQVWKSTEVKTYKNDVKKFNKNSTTFQNSTKKYYTPLKYKPVKTPKNRTKQHIAKRY